MEPEFAAGENQHSVSEETRPFEKDEAGATQWRPVTCILFRFAFTYFALDSISALLALLPGALADKTVLWYLSVWQVIVDWVGSHLLHLAQPATFHPTGSGDTLFAWVYALCNLCLALAATVVWSIVARRRASHPRLFQWFRLLLRVVLGVAMLTYGAFKVIKSQFPDPSLARLLQPYGDSSPMGLLWTMMGASNAYNVFTGAVEFTAGILLFIPGLTTLGALIAMLAMGNVFMLNMCYDVPVKLYSFQLLTMAFLLALPDLRRLADFLVFHRPAQIPRDPSLFQRRWLQTGATAAILLLGAFNLYGALQTSYQGRKGYLNRVRNSSFYGIWMVDEFTADGEAHPLTFTDTARWYRLIFNSDSAISIQSVDGAQTHYRIRVDAARKTITFSQRENPARTFQFSFERTPAALTLSGQLEGRNITARMHHEDPPTFLLNTRGFHWVSEYPFNR